MPRKKKAEQPMTTAQQLGSIIKSARQIMRKDKGLSGDLDRLPILTWVMFLKFLDDLEQLRETEAVLEGKEFQPAIEQPYRWRDWAAVEGGITGEELIAFINQEQATLPDGKQGSGLFAYLKNLQGANGGDRRDVIATVFKGLQNRMLNGYLLRDVIDKINDIHFNSSEEMHTLSRLYETLLREMRDAAGDSGEFYTPRPVVRFMVEVTNPQLGETILDPACGTGGFLVEAMRHLEDQCNTVEDRETLQSSSLYGGEAKPLPFLLVQMNLLLHGLEYPRIDPENSLRFPLREIGDRDRVDLILTNPPFGGEEEKGILGNFPDDMQTSETALLFLQLIMRKLKRPSPDSNNGGRAAVVVPESVMSDGGVARRVRKELVDHYNLHTVVRLPKGVFEPYADIQTNLLFFDRTGPTSHISYWQLEVPLDRRNMKNPCYTRTNPLQYDELLPILDWWDDRPNNDFSWTVAVDHVRKSDYTLDYRNPNIEELEVPKPSDIIQAIHEPLSTALISLESLNDSMQALESLKDGSWKRQPLKTFIHRVKNEAEVLTDVEYKQITVKLYGKGVTLRKSILGSAIKTRPQFIASSGHLIMSRIDARNGAFGLVPLELDGALVTQDFPLFGIDKDIMLPDFLALLLRSQQFIEACKRSSKGTTNRKRLKEGLFLDEKVPVPSIEHQHTIINLLGSLQEATSNVYSATEVAESASMQVGSYILS